MDKRMEAAFKFIDDSRDEMLGLWEDVVNTESGSKNKEGIAKVAAKFRKVLDEEGFETRIVEYENAGNALVGKLGMDRAKAPVAFMGHMDTVFPDGTVAQRPFKIEDGKAYGPGVLDMKGGIVAALYAIKALNHIGYNERPIKTIYAGDEEVGHANSTCDDLYVEEARGCAAAFNCETGFQDNGIVVGRKGVARFDLEIEGVSVHAGNEPENGRSAILEAAHKVIDIQNLTDWEDGTTFNVGTIKGGTVSNAVPDYCKIEVDVRYVKELNAEKLVRQMNEVAAKTYVEGTKTKMTGGVIFKPMEVTEGTLKLLELVNKTAKEIGQDEFHPITVGGGSDSAYSVIAGVPTVCAMGPKGGYNHTPREFAIVESFFERAKLMVASVLNLE